MAIPMAVVLGLACAFYIYVAIRWYLEALLIRREDKRSSSAMAASVRQRAPAITRSLHEALAQHSLHPPAGK